MEVLTKFMFILIVLILMQVTSGKPIPPNQITWHLVAVSPTIAQGYSYKLFIQEESGVKKVVPLTNILCGNVNNIIQCSSPLPTTAYSAIISNNVSQISATDPKTLIESELSTTFTGDQGCIFRNLLYSISSQGSAETRKQDMQELLAEFKAAKFKHIRTEQLAGNRFRVIEECVGYIVP